ncbi:DNA utilization protein HofN [Citrobacter amalonaticus]|uniref:DNA utilization protein HofN n=1 Tax=Citrobacter amalonaticus TaxID=35703 RepID=A0A2S4RUU5_CITAM|nr:PilN domain-containing protein [Citrobacter amalonaticus]POT55412.1 DNA utilization protein HofN [Citrobacter amalonaticus]POT73623.1 DNA utilization protein HofN [Citrobacter amalonaticus]POU63847.1 DNA utilization protein HofN [Citrobacter amalonaticus]POV03481.1 DNA utilization protein HofN [Citrobacter amalonaticus]
MNKPINLMPWRQMQRTACLRFWGVMFTLSLLVVFGVVLRFCVVLYEDARIDAVLLQADKHCLATLLATKPRWQQRQQLWQQALHRQQQREQTLRWQSVLKNLATLIPEQAWLTQLVWQHDTLELAGKALTFVSLSELEASLRRQPEFRIRSTGGTQQDAQGRWQFQYQLIRGRDDELSR